jgi:hypothetical protein
VTVDGPPDATHVPEALVTRLDPDVVRPGRGRPSVEDEGVRALASGVYDTPWRPWIGRPGDDDLAPLAHGGGHQDERARS